MLGRRLRVLGWEEEELGDGTGIGEEMRGAKAWQEKGLWERGEPMGWRRGRGRSWSGPGAFPHCTGWGKRRLRGLEACSP